MKRTPKEIKQQTEEWLDERWMIANMKDARPQDMSYYMGALKALEFAGYEWKRDADVSKDEKHKIMVKTLLTLQNQLKTRKYL